MASSGTSAISAAAIVLVLLRGGEAIAAAPACGPTAIVAGDEAVVAPIRTSLRQRGIGSVADPDCPVVRARVRQADPGLAVVIEDPHGRRSERTVADGETAATLIESWVRTDVSDPLLAGTPLPPASPADDETPVVLRPVPVRPVQPRPIGIALSGTTSVASDGSLWLGAEISACVRLGHTCVGATAHVSSDVGVSGSSEKLETSRLGMDLLVTVDAPLAWGGISVTPGVAVGLGWMRTGSVRDGLAPSDVIDIDSGGLRTSARVTFSVPLGRAFALDLGVAASASPLAHSAPFATDGTSLAGEPRGYLSAGIGLRYGAP